jgi:hypothetical protein
MEIISDPFEFDHVIAIVRERARALPDTQDELTHLLGTLIEDALAELTGQKFATARSIGDLDSADGIAHLLNDYPAQAPPGKFFREAFLTVEEDAAARHLLKLYLARDFLHMGFGLPEDSIREIDATGRELLAWRLHGPAFQHGKDKRKQSRAQQDRASKNRKSVTKQDLESHRDAFIYAKGDDHGWVKQACIDFGITSKTLNKRMEE